MRFNHSFDVMSSTEYSVCSDDDYDMESDG
jgi:hypothetical protein